jgi:16S rRNA C1402 N4-methylase RsmH
MDKIGFSIGNESFKFEHKPVLLDECIAGLDIKPTACTLTAL